MNLNDRVGDWMIHHVIAPVVWRAMQIAGSLEPAGPAHRDPLEVKPYIVTAPHGIEVDGASYACGDRVELTRAVAGSLGGSVDPDFIDTEVVWK